MISYDFATHSEQTAFIGLLLSVTKHAMSEHLYELKQISRLSIRSASTDTPFTNHESVDKTWHVLYQIQLQSIVGLNTF